MDTLRELQGVLDGVEMEAEVREDEGQRMLSTKQFRQKRKVGAGDNSKAENVVYKASRTIMKVEMMRYGKAANENVKTLAQATLDYCL